MLRYGRGWLTRSLAVQLQIEEVSRKLRSGDLGIPANIEERCVLLYHVPVHGPPPSVPRPTARGALHARVTLRLELNPIFSYG